MSREFHQHWHRMLGLEVFSKVKEECGEEEE